jgi:hypothetical protein
LESITCPGCQKPIRVPADVLGQRAQCPFCKCHFRAPVRADDGTLSPPVLLRKNPFAQSRTYAPGVALILVGLLGMMSNGLRVAHAYSDPEEFARQTRETFEKAGFPEAERTVRWMPLARVGFLVMGALVVGGGVAMVRRRWHGLAMIGGVSALFSVADCCCVLGFPAGGWALFVLRDPAVRAEFYRPADRGPVTE